MILSVNYLIMLVKLYISDYEADFFNYLRSILTTFHRKKCKILEILCNFVYRMMFHVGLMILSLFVFAWLWEIEDLRMIFRIQSCMWYLYILNLAYDVCSFPGLWYFYLDEIVNAMTYYNRVFSLFQQSWV